MVAYVRTILKYKNFVFRLTEKISQISSTVNLSSYSKRAAFKSQASRGKNGI